MTNFYLYTDKDGNIAKSETTDNQTFFLNKDAVVIGADSLDHAKEKYLKLKENGFKG